MKLDDQRPTLALVLEIDEIYLHCPQSLRRSEVWNPASWQTG
ncbi:putative pyridoxine 5'-phosphate oxidase superfamily flavin-nucleotide-binding protein [Streptomyces umbrinus]|uniref:Pyridoxine 5'-phosphate oxidase superfamily flavin-nucleotide-binding protein n=1 Tax=Streptomyces umbrinus TaxID=67370 RepID=A0ABU0SIL3_9ACTN|nr:putative pyridoxine 5'-phosphate oxidase superfamily flavin-nucleotide-binding protein [Streptomyces umbrinus]